MFKKTLMTAAAALAITVGATTISTPDANAGVKFNPTLATGNYKPVILPGYCFWIKKHVLITYWKNGKEHHKWVWKSTKACF